jgi:CubicO group peptidase (beta-lactamase class C family)
MPRKRFLHISFAILFVASSLCAPFAHAQSPQTQTQQPAARQDDAAARVAAIEKAFDEKRKEAGVPGASLVVVVGDHVIVLKGSGVRDAAKNLPVTPDTLFAIGSCTKAFTAMAAVISQDDGKLSLDDSPKRYLPYFHLRDPEADAQATLRDLLSHRTGLGGTDIAWFTGVLSREEVIRVAGRAKPTAKLREKFQYQNVMYSAAGETVAHAQGTTWENLVASRILKPLGMTKTLLTVREMQSTPDYSLGYVYDAKAKQAYQVPTRDLTNIAPAGAINSSAREMAEWLKFLVAGGVAPNGKRLVSEKGFAEILTPQIKMNETTSYALGWGTTTVAGHKIYVHNGGIDGFGAQVAFLPAEKIGFAVLANVEDTPLLSAMTRAVVSNLLDAAPQATSANANASGVKSQEFAGRYDLAAANMVITVTSENGKLYLTAPGQPRYTLELVEGRRYRFAEVEGFYATFRPAKDDATQIEMYLEQPQGNYTLPRIKEVASPASAMATATISDSFKELIGTYELAQGGVRVEVKLKDDKVVLSVAGQPDYPLVEKAKDVYSSPILPDSYSILARRDAAGKISSILIRQPEGENEMKRVAETNAAASVSATTTSAPIAVEDLLTKMIAAAGGESNLRRHKSMTTTASIAFENQGLEGESVIYTQAPNAYAREVTFTAFGKKLGTTREFFDGATGGEETSFTARATKWGERKLAEVRASEDFYEPLDWKTLYKSIAVKEVAKVNGEDAYVVVLTPQQGAPATVYVSTKTFLVLRRDSVELDATGDSSAPVKTFYSDYHAVEGVLVPFSVSYDVPGTGEATVRVRDVKFDAPITTDAFRARKPTE